MSKNNQVRFFAIAAAGFLAFALGGPASAFHGGGVATCDGCHTMHQSADNPLGSDDAPNAAVASGFLLKGTDASSTCLNCHAGAGKATSYHIFSEDASAQTPGGDFFWLTKSFTNSNWSGDVISDPDQMGHNVIAADWNLTQDLNNTAAPGGAYLSVNLGCTSCHDPHGQVLGGTGGGQLPISESGSYGDVPVAGTIAGNYRLLGDTGHGLAAAPIAVTQYATRFAETDAAHPAYGQGMSEWCGSCHPDFVVPVVHKHIAGNTAVLGSLASNYNSYIETGDFNGVPATSYNALVPFERQETDKATLLADYTGTAGPDASDDNVMCLSCHRAHASAFENITRWDMTEEFLIDSLPGATELGTMGVTDVTAPYYGRDITTVFGAYQRSLCNKCHVKD